MGKGTLDSSWTTGLHQFLEGKKAIDGCFDIEEIPQDLHTDVKGGEDKKRWSVPQSSSEDHKVPSHNWGGDWVLFWKVEL